MFFFFNLTNEGEVDTMDEAKAKHSLICYGVKGMVLRATVV